MYSPEKLNESDLTEEEKSLVESVCEELMAYPFVMAVYLFGSHAKHCSKPYSDIDIAVLLREPAERNEIETAGSYSSKILDVEIFSLMPITVKMGIIYDGILLYSRDSRYLRDITRANLLEYFDSEPMRRRVNKRFISSFSLK
jgi:predicted nucleotidyltransferase